MEKKNLKVCVYAISKNEAKFVKRWCDSMKEADKIVVLDDGQVSEMGTPAELMKKDGLYAHLVKLQQGR